MTAVRSTKFKDLLEPEFLFVGEVIGGSMFECKNAFSTLEVQFGSQWECVGGDISAQTQVDYPQDEGNPVWNHPIDLHFYANAIQGWPHILFEVFTLNVHGVRDIYGYGFTFLPTQPGEHELEVNIWRPSGSTKEEYLAFFLGGRPELVSKDVLVAKAKEDRCRLVTTSVGKIHLRVEALFRHTKAHGIS